MLNQSLSKNNTFSLIIIVLFLCTSCLNESTIHVKLFGSTNGALGLAPELHTVSDPTNPVAIFSKPDGSKIESFECQIDSSAWQTCSSPLSLSIDSKGEHTVRVRGRLSDGTFTSSSSATVVKGQRPLFLNGEVKDIVELSDGSSLWAGDFSAINSNSAGGFAKVSYNNEWTYNCLGGNHFDGNVYSSYVLSDNSIILGGKFSTYKGTTTNRIIKLNENCEVDSTFQTNVGSGFDGFINDTIWDIAEHPTDGIILVGDFTQLNSQVIPNDIVLIAEDGSVDLSPGSFNDNLGSGSIGASRILTNVEVDGTDIYVAGSVDDINSVGVPYGLLKIEPDGTIDLSPGSFNDGLGAGFSSLIWSIDLDSNAIYAGGNFDQYNGGAIAENLAKVSRVDGSLDTTFNMNLGTGFDNHVRAVYVDSTNLYVGGRFSGLDGTPIASRLAKLDAATGFLNTTFNNNLGEGLNSDVNVIHENPNDSNYLMIGGLFTLLDNKAGSARGLLMLSKEGIPGASNTPLEAFEAGTTGGVHVIRPTSDGIIFGGGFTQIGGTKVPKGLVKFSPDLSLDESFNANLNDGANLIVNTIELTPSEDIYIGGNFTHFSNATPQRISKIFSDGSLDTNFIPNNLGEGFNNEVLDLSLLGSDLFVATRSSEYRSVSVPFGIVKIDEQGALESAVAGFNDSLGSGFSYSEPFPSAKINQIVNNGTDLYLAGTFDELNGPGVSASLIKVDPTNADITNSFNTNLGGGLTASSGSETINSVFIHNNEINIAGIFNQLDGTSAAQNVNIIDDSAFALLTDSTTPSLFVNSHTIFEEKIILGGTPMVIGETSLLFYNQDGTPDTTLNSKFGTGLQGGSVTLVKKIGSYLYVFGTFASLDGEPIRSPLRLDANFEIDPSFNTNQSN